MGGERGLKHVHASPPGMIARGVRRAEVIDDAAHDLQQQVFLAVDMVVEAADFESGGRGDLPQPGGVVATLKEKLGRFRPDHIRTAAFAQYRHGVPPFCLVKPVSQLFGSTVSVSRGVDFRLRNSFTDRNVRTIVLLHDEVCLARSTIRTDGPWRPDAAEPLRAPPAHAERAQADGIPTSPDGRVLPAKGRRRPCHQRGHGVSPQGSAYAQVPGLYTQAQVEAWRPVVAAARSKGAAVYAQLWHVGRQAHSCVQPEGALPLGPLPIATAGWEYRSPDGPVPFEVPRELSAEGIAEIVTQFAAAARNAAAAGFDGRAPRGKRLPV